MKKTPSSTENFRQSNHLSLSVEGQSNKVITLIGFTGGICAVSDAVFEPLKSKLTEKILPFTRTPTIISIIYSSKFIVQNLDGEYGLMNESDEMKIPFAELDGEESYNEYKWKEIYI